jgi:hypothetical protein
LPGKPSLLHAAQLSRFESSLSDECKVMPRPVNSDGIFHLFRPQSQHSIPILLACPKAIALSDETIPCSFVLVKFSFLILFSRESRG